jgi:PGF-CTERM protein
MSRDGREGDMRLGAAALALVLAASAIGGTAAPAATQQAEGESYSGAFVEFETTGAAVSDYAVDGSVVVESVTAQSASETEGDLGAGVDAVTSVNGSVVGVDSSGAAGATVTTESGAEMEAHDNERGVLQVHANGESQVVEASVSGESESESDGRVVVSNDDGSQGAFVVVGDGEVTTNEDGDVVAQIDGDGRLVYRQYNEGRTDEDETQEQLIQDGTATAEVYVNGAAKSGSEAEGEATSVVEYGQDTSVEVQERSESQVNMTVERTESQGKVVITTVSESAVENAENLEVYVDGEAAARADSYGEVRSATQDGNQSRYLVRQDSSAEASTDVVVGVNHFSERNVSIQSDGETGGDDGDGLSGADGPGFGALAALAALAAALVAARYRA